jgi:peptidoglycan/LPS O-acetylase OafA/YrhL
MEPRQYAYIDALRGLAILLVFTDHVSLAVGGDHGILAQAAALGQTGVQLFFVASALTLSLSARSRGLEGGRDIRDFWLRRFFRIAPLYWFAILLYAAGGLVNTGHWTLTTERALANALFVHGFIPDANNNVVPGGWSIGTEMAFYLLFPLLWHRLGSRRRAWAFFLAALAASLGVAFWATWPDGRVENNSFLYFNLVTQMPVFALGIVAYHRIRSGALPPVWLLLGGALALVGVAGLFWKSGWRLAFSVTPVLFGGAYLCLTLAATRFRGWWLYRLGDVGKVSYAVYVTHFLIIWTVALTLPFLKSVDPHGVPAFLLLWFAAGALSLAAASLLHRAVESPGIRLGSAAVGRLRKQECGAVPD